MQSTLARIEVGHKGLFALNDKIEKLNRRARKLGLTEVSVRIMREFTVIDEHTGYEYDRFDIEIEGVAPCINGWSLAARIENNPTIGTVVRVVPGRFEDDDYSKYRNHDFSCDHCNTKRRRNDVFVLKNSEGFERVIGRNCLADYLRTEDAEAFARFAEFVDQFGLLTDEGLCGDADEMGYGSHGHRPNLPLVRYLATVRCCTRRIGWTSRSAAYDDLGRTATADDAYYVIFGSGAGHQKFIKKNELYVNKKDYEIAEQAVRWAAALTNCKSEYLDTISRIAKAGETDEKLSGYAASIVRAWEKDQEWKKEREEKAKGRKEKDYIGKIGKAQDIGVVTIKGTHFFETDFGVKTIVRMEAELPDNKVAPIVWFATGEQDYDEGDRYFLRAGVKEQTEHEKYGKQTVVARAKLTPA